MIYIPQFADEGEAIARCSITTCKVVPAEELAEVINADTSHVVAVYNGAFVTGPLVPRSGIMSAYYRRGADVDLWWEAINPAAFAMSRETLIKLGGFPDMVFEYHKVLALKAHKLGIPCEATGDAIADAIPHPARQTAIGDLYYRQLEDQRTYSLMADS